MKEASPSHKCIIFSQWTSMLDLVQVITEIVCARERKKKKEERLRNAIIIFQEFTPTLSTIHACDLHLIILVHSGNSSYYMSIIPVKVALKKQSWKHVRLDGAMPQVYGSVDFFLVNIRMLKGKFPINGRTCCLFLLSSFLSYLNFSFLSSLREFPSPFPSDDLYIWMKQVQRAHALESFRTDSSISVFLVSLRSGGVGLNLTAASRMC